MVLIEKGFPSLLTYGIEIYDFLVTSVIIKSMKNMYYDFANKNTRYEVNCYFTMINQHKYFLFYIPLHDLEGVYGHIFSYRRQLDFLLA